MLSFIGSNCKISKPLDAVQKHSIKFHYCGRHFIIREENSKLKTNAFAIFIPPFLILGKTWLYIVIQIQLKQMKEANSWHDQEEVGVGVGAGGVGVWVWWRWWRGEGVNRSLLALHQSEPFWPHSHSDLGLVLQPIILPWENIQSLHRHIKIYFLHRNQDSLAFLFSFSFFKTFF